MNSSTTEQLLSCKDLSLTTGTNSFLVTADSPGQILLLHSRVSVALPTQSLPPFAGLGLVQVLERVFCPTPQVLEQDDHSIH